MIRESKELLAKYDRFFLREYGTLYWLLVVDNHFFDKYYFFLEKRKVKGKLEHSRELLCMEHNPAKFGQVMADLKAHSQLRIVTRDTHHLVHPTTAITHDLMHGHS